MKPRNFDNYEDAKTCPCCEGRGWYYTGIAIEWYGALRFLPKFKPCKSCLGEGWVYKTIDEIDFDRGCRRDESRGDRFLNS